MLLQIALGSLMIVATTVVHAAFMVLLIRLVDKWTVRHESPSTFGRLCAVGGTILLMFVASVIEACAWAVAFVMLGAISGWEPALYFSVVTLTTLGYGDIVLDPQWRLFGAIEAANGVIMFGCSTAVVVAVVQRMFSRDGAGRHVSTKGTGR